MKRYQTRVPSEYQEITYLSNNYNQYINPNLKGSDLANCEIEIVMKNLSTNTTEYNFNGVYESGKVAQLGLVATSATECRASINFGFASAISVTNLPIDDYHTIYVSDGLQKVDGVTVGTNSFGTLSNDNFLLFARTNIDISQISICPKMALKSFTVKKNNQYIRNMIPVKRLSDDAFGLYDLANSVFYTNQGTGVFNAGTNVNNYTWQTKSPPRYGTATDAVTTLPVTLYTDGQPVSSYTIKGNTSTSGTPSPSNPITIEGVGEKTANLCNPIPYKTDYYIDANGVETAFTGIDIYKVSASAETTYTLSLDIILSGTRVRIHAYNNGSWMEQITEAVISTLPQTFTTPQGCDEVRFSISNGAMNHIMLNTGSTPLPYEPYGKYKISISSNQAALSPIYLSQPLRKSLDGTAFDTLDSTGLVTYNVDEYGQPQTATTETVTVPTITTTGGEVSIDVDTTVKPSEISLTYHGWHSHEPLKRENSSWS